MLPSSRRLPLLINSLGVGVLSIPLILFGWLTFQRPPQTNLEKPLFQGITYRREFRSSPRPIMLHVVTIDLTTPGIKVLVTPGEQRSIESETNARTTSEFLQEFNLQLAVNASFFHPFKEVTPWDYYPRSDDRVGAVGQAISNGVEYSFPLSDWSVLCVSSQQRAQILQQDQCPEETTQAVAGSSVIVKNGRTIPAQAGSADSDANYSRTAVAIDATGNRLWIIVVDDKQWLYSEGVSLVELAEMAIALGADAALNLDGGGSTTLVAETSRGFSILNSPVHTKIPMRERPVANHLGFYASPLPLPKEPRER
ncbi:MAG: phosphodiester glycosidase family protein [Leptolyngbyaceae cyanobacterium bins.302]|nr:phosphodiester glycosidase family protein [Leptolyngbyaceae cyanobacterium bins.302]